MIQYTNMPYGPDKGSKLKKCLYKSKNTTDVNF